MDLAGGNPDRDKWKDNEPHLVKTNRMRGLMGCNKRKSDRFLA